MTTILDFNIHIRRAGEDSSYLVTAQGPGTGLAGPEMLDWRSLSDPDFEDLVRRIHEEPRSVKQADYSLVGDVLFKALFMGQVLRLFTGQYDNIVEINRDAAMRLRLDIDERAPKIAVLPWEFLYWRSKNLYLSTSVQTLLTRQLLNLNYGNMKPLKVDGMPKVLLVIPKDSRYGTASEKARAMDALAKAGITPKVLPEEPDGLVDVQMVSDELSNDTYHILHFIGDGEFKEDYDGNYYGSLRFNPHNPVDDADEESWVTHTQLQALLSPYADDLKLVVLIGCKSSEITSEGFETDIGKRFVGIVPAILSARIPAVLAMQYRIRYDVTIDFVEVFYKRLTVGRWAGQVDAALNLARNACLLNYPDDRGFATPVLYLNAIDGKIFDLQGS